MNPQQSQMLIFFANAAIAGCFASGLGLIVNWICRRRSIALQYGILLWSIAAVSLSPLILLATMQSRLGWSLVSVQSPEVDAVNPNQESKTFAGIDHLSNQAGRDERIESLTSSAIINSHVFNWLNLGRMLGCIWIAGSILSGVSLLRGCLRLKQFWHSLRVCDDVRVLRPADEAFRLAKMRPVALMESKLTTLPLCLGLIRPAIVVPANHFVDLDERQIQLVLLHEIAHLKRRDQWAALLQLIGATVFWWNPLVHMLNARLGTVREQMCDDYAVSYQKNGRGLAELLVRFAEANSTALTHRAFANALFNNDLHDLEQRVRRLLDRRLERNRKMSRTAVAVAMIVGISGFALLAIPILRADASARVLPTLKTSISQQNIRHPFDTPVKGTAELKPTRNLSGNWLMHLPAGFDRRITLERIDEDHYRFSPKGLTMAGVYRLDEDRLTIEKPNDRRLTGFQWEIQAPNHLVLVAQPSRNKVGANYLGASLACDQPTEQ